MNPTYGPYSFPYPYGYTGMSGMGQIIPGVKPQTQQLVIYGSLVLVGGSILLYLVLKGGPTSAV